MLSSVDSISLVSGTARRNIYINEHLTPMNRLFHKKARDLRDKIKFVWTKDCKVLTIPAEILQRCARSSADDASMAAAGAFQGFLMIIFI